MLIYNYRKRFLDLKGGYGNCYLHEVYKNNSENSKFKEKIKIILDKGMYI